jgi:hypothetical protein
MRLAPSLRGLAVSLTALGASAAVAHAQTLTPPMATLCLDGVVAKERLSRWALDISGVSRAPEDWIESLTAEPVPQAVIRARVLSPDRFCRSEFSEAEQAGSAAPPDSACGSADAVAIGKARQAINSMLLGLEPGFDGLPGVTRARFFEEAGLQMHCRVSEARPVLPTFEYSLPLRVRGSTDSLNIARGDPALASAAASALSYSEDAIKDKSTTKVTLVVGWPIALPASMGSEWELVPYVGMNRDLSKVDGAAASVTTDTYQYGVALNATVRSWTQGSGAIGHRFSLRPDFMRNDEENSEVGSVSASWMPVVNGRLNDFMRLDPGRDRFFYWKPIFEVRAVYGEFLDQGSRTDEASQDFFRLGGQVGFSIVSDNPRWPLQFTATDTFLPAIRGFEDLEYLEARLSLWLDPEKIFSVELTYGEGRRTDVEPEADGWKLSLGAKY